MCMQDILIGRKSTSRAWRTSGTQAVPGDARRIAIILTVADATELAFLRAGQSASDPVLAVAGSGDNMAKLNISESGINLTGDLFLQANNGLGCDLIEVLLLDNNP